jgi:hypothetical protein
VWRNRPGAIAGAADFSPTIHRPFLGLQTAGAIVAGVKRILQRPVTLGAVVGAVGLLGLILALSLSHGAGGAATTTTPSASRAGTTSTGRDGGAQSTASIAARWHNLAQCFRSHGYTIADPTVNTNGTSSWSDGSGGPPAVLRNAMRAVGDQTCQSELDALPQQLVTPPPTSAELHQLVLFAGCMRAHGLSDWPDPRSDGAFPLNARLRAAGKRGIMSQLLVCRHLTPGNGIAIHDPNDGPKPNATGR